MIKLKIKKILSVLLAALLISMVGIPAFAADDTGAGDGETPAASSDYDYTKDERLFNASNPEQYNDGDYQWGGIAPAMYGIIANKMYTVNQINKATEIAEAKKEAEEEVAARKAQEEKEKEKENGKQETAEGDNATYTITFNDNEGSGGPGTQTGKSGVNELSTTYPKRKGYTFIGWDEDKDAVAPAYVLGGVWEIELSADVTLYAIWDDGIPALEDETSAAPKVEGVKVVMTHIGGYPGKYAPGIRQRLELSRSKPSTLSNARSAARRSARPHCSPSLIRMRASAFTAANIFPIPAR